MKGPITVIQIGNEKTCGFDLSEDEVQKKDNEDFHMFLFDEESSALHHSVTKAKSKKKKKVVVSSKEFLEFSKKVDHILSAFINL